jgi:hypothetical protein
MECVKTVRDFALRNSDDLKRFMVFKTGIRDRDIIMDTIQEFYVKLIETKALETYDPAKGAFKTYIMNLFCWLFPVLANRNHNVKYTFLSCTKDRNHSGQWDGGYTDIFEDVAAPGRSPYVEHVVDGSYISSHVTEDEELETEISIKEFVEHIKRTQTKKAASRIVPYIEYRNCGCNGADVAQILGVSNNMVKMIKERTKVSFEQWRGHKMNTGKKTKQLTYEQVVDEIRHAQDMITKYNAGDVSLPHGFSYRDVVLRLKYLRNRQSQLSKKRRKPKCD